MKIWTVEAHDESEGERDYLRYAFTNEEEACAFGRKILAIVTEHELVESAPNLIRVHLIHARHVYGNRLYRLESRTEHTNGISLAHAEGMPADRDWVEVHCNYEENGQYGFSIFGYDYQKVWESYVDEQRFTVIHEED